MMNQKLGQKGLKIVNLASDTELMDAGNDNCVVGPDDNHREAVYCAERDKPYQPELD